MQAIQEAGGKSMVLSSQSLHRSVRRFCIATQNAINICCSACVAGILCMVRLPSSRSAFALSNLCWTAVVSELQLAVIDWRAAQEEPHRSRCQRTPKARILLVSMR